MGRAGRWPTWAYGAIGAGYALAAGFTAISAAPWLFGPPELEFDEPPTKPATEAGQVAVSLNAYSRMIVITLDIIRRCHRPN